MAKDTKVNLSDVEEILKNEIKLNHLSSCNNPSIIFITGVSGSGKSTIIAKLKGNFIKIQSDNYRKLHPKIKELKVKLGRNEVYKKTGNYSFEFAKTLCHRAIENRLNIVFEATFSKLETARTLIEPFIKNGYQVVIVKLPINVDLSIERNQKRYKEKQAQEHMIPRMTNRENIEKMVDTYNETLDALEKIGIKIINLDTFSSEVIKIAL